MVAGSWLFAYSYCITFIAGEVKRPDKTIILANLSAILVPAFFMTWLAIVLYRTVGFEFLSATAWVDNSGEALAGYTFPWSPNFVGLAAVITQNKIRGLHDGPLVHPVQSVVGGAILPGFPTHSVRLGHGPDGSQVVRRY